MGLESLPAEMREKLTTKIFVEEPGCLEAIPEIVSRVNPAKLPILLVCDPNTRQAAGERVGKILAGAGAAFEELSLDSRGEKVLSADYAGVAAIREVMQGRQVFPVAVGSGVINDLVKRAAFEAGTPYLCAATASSMDGYASYGAALVKEGYKLTLPCDAPAAIVADPEILCHAPYDMTASGYGDLYAKLVAGVDWVLADRLALQPIAKEIWDLVQLELPAWVGSPEKLKAGDPAAFSGIFRGLTMSGIAMQIYHDSRPASGAEHLIGHIWEMDHLSRPDGVPFSHGFKVAVGIVLSASLMEALYKITPEKIQAARILKNRESWESREASVWKAFPDKKVGAPVLETCRKKWLDEKAHAVRIEQLAALLPEMKKAVEERLGSRDRVIADLKKAGCPVSPADLGLGSGAVRDVFIKAQMIRTRYTVLDAAYELGLLEELAE